MDLDTELETPTLRVGELVSTTLGVLRSRGASFVLVAGLCLTPATLFSLATRGDGPTPEPLSGHLALLITLLGVYFAQASIVHVTVAHLREHPAGTMDSLRAASFRVATVAVTGLLRHLGVVLGVLLFVGPGVWLWVASFVALPVAMVDGVGPIDAMKRSFELTRGHRLAIFFAALAFGAVTFVSFCCLVGSLTLFTEAETGGVSFAVWVAELALRAVVVATLGTLGGVVLTRLRSLPRIDAEEIADAFR
jgi:hypothetical protein